VRSTNVTLALFLLKAHMEEERGRIRVRVNASAGKVAFTVISLKTHSHSEIPSILTLIHSVSKVEEPQNISLTISSLFSTEYQIQYQKLLLLLVVFRKSQNIYINSQ